MKMRLKPSMEMQLVQHSASGTAELIAGETRHEMLWSCFVQLYFNQLQ